MTNAPDPGYRLQWTLGDRLYKSLRVSGVSNADMAEALGVSRNTIGNYISDRTEPKDLYLKEWALRTGIPFEELKYGTTHTNGPTTPGGQTTDYGSVGSASWHVAPVVSLTKLAA